MSTCAGKIEKPPPLERRVVHRICVILSRHRQLVFFATSMWTVSVFAVEPSREESVG